MAIVGAFEKQPAEIFAVDIDYDGKLPSGASLSSGTVSAVDLSDDSDVTGTVLVSATATIVGDKTQATVQNGTAGEDYKIEFKTTLDNGNILEDELIMLLRES